MRRHRPERRQHPIDCCVLAVAGGIVDEGDDRRRQSGAAGDEGDELRQDLEHIYIYIYIHIYIYMLSSSRRAAQTTSVRPPHGRKRPGRRPSARIPSRSPLSALASVTFRPGRARPCAWSRRQRRRHQRKGRPPRCSWRRRG